MSSNSTNFTSSSSSFSYSSSSSNIDGQVSGQRSTQHTQTDSSGNTTVNKTSQNMGGPAVQETRSYDAQGRETLGGTGGSGSRKIEDVSDEEQAKRDREYEERIEEE